MNIRKANLFDLDIIVNFNINLAKETESKELNFDTVKKGVLKILEGKINGEYFVCEVNKKVVGQIMILFEWSDWKNGEFIWIQSVYVDKDYRKQGVFKKLYNHIEEYLYSNDRFVGLRLYVDIDNNKAKKTYESLGMYKNNYDMYEYLKE